MSVLRQRLLVPVIGACALAACALAACSDSDPEPSSATGSADSGVDAAQPVVDSSVEEDGATPVADSGGDASDAGPARTTSVGPTGAIRIYMDAIFATFSEDDTIVRTTEAPECVVHVRSISKPFSSAGVLKVGGPIVGSDGGADAPIEVMPDTMDPAGLNQYFHFGPVFPPSDTLQVQLESDGTTVFPAMPVQTMRPPPASAVVVTKPLVPDGGASVVVPSTAPYEITWTVPAGASADHRVVFGLRELSAASGAAKSASLFCSYPLSAGKGTIPVSVLADLKARVGANASGRLHIYAGGYKEFVASGASYAIEVVREDSTSFSMGVGGEATGELK